MSVGADKTLAFEERWGICRYLVEFVSSAVVSVCLIEFLSAPFSPALFYGMCSPHARASRPLNSNAKLAEILSVGTAM